MTQIDTQLFYGINQLAGRWPAVDFFFKAVAEGSPILLLLFIGVRWFYGSSLPQVRQRLFPAVLAVLPAEGLGWLAGQFYAHPQPFAMLPDVQQLIAHKVDNAFPSDHSLLFFSVLTVLFLTSNRPGLRWGYPAAAVLVGISRIWVGVHLPLDVAAAALIGIAAAWLTLKLATSVSVLRRLNEGLSRLFLPAAAKEAAGRSKVH